MKFKVIAASMLAALVALPAIAEAAEGFATANVNMRSGPSTAYPAVTMIPVGVPLQINGCLNETPWCDVSFYGGRGWVAGRYIQATYQSRRIYVDPQYYRPLGIPTVVFNFDDYWGRYYRGRDFYRDRDRWRRGPSPVYRRPDRNPGWDQGSDWDNGPDRNWDRRPDRNRDWNSGSDWNDGQDQNWNRRPDRNRDGDRQRDDNRDWGRQQPDNNQGSANRPDRQPRPEPQQRQPQAQPQPQPQNNPRPNAGAPGPYSPDHKDPCPASEPNCRMSVRGSNR
ncbi:MULTISPECIES: SH3 domain-containing protein [Rhizobium]|uniref:SH3 domain-containing protein n=1 Tax=Rhizobium TaxID=379 RepID=UPI00195EFC9A|nr:MULTISPECIES: SH3 domain-containing protein [Rhizobium]MBM7050405.1 SH3 domain-containing protein [Rhizobium lusitanum]